VLLLSFKRIKCVGKKTLQIWDQLGDLNIDGRVILKRILINTVESYGSSSSGTVWKLMGAHVNTV
jgi:hypothetical protein